MVTASSAHKPSPEKIFAALNAYQETAALKAAIELDVFTAIGQGSQEAKAIAEKVKVSEKGVRVLCDYLVIHGFLGKENGKYQLPEESAIFLSKGSPAYMGSVIGFLGHEWHAKQFTNLSEIVRNGGAISSDGDNTKPNDEAWVAFARSMAPMMMMPAKFIAGLLEASSGKPMKILDIAAGHGMYGITLAKENPNVHVTAVDWPAVLEVAKENAGKQGVASRYEVRAGSAFETELGTNYDYVLLTNILHHFDMPTCEKLMRRAHAALKPGGKAVTVEFVPNEDRVSPPTPAAFSLIMLAHTNAGDAYTFTEYETMFGHAGFGKTTIHPITGTPQTVLISEKRP